MIEEILNLGINTATITRFSQSHLSRNESVMEHIGFVSLFCLIIATKHGNINIERVLKKAISHDLEESKLGDIIATTKKYNKEINIKIEEVADIYMKEISKDVNCEQLYDYWKDAKDDSIEGRLIALADIASVVLKIIEETRIYNNRSITNHILNILPILIRKEEKEHDKLLKQVLKELIEISDELIQEFKIENHSWFLLKNNRGIDSCDCCGKTRTHTLDCPIVIGREVSTKDNLKEKIDYT